MESLYEKRGRGGEGEGEEEWRVRIVQNVWVMHEAQDSNMYGWITG